MGRNSIYNIGDIFGGLKVIEILPSNKSGKHVMVRCFCEYCNSEKIMHGANLKKRKSCGCQQRNSRIWPSSGPKKMSWLLEPGQSAKNNTEYQYKRSAIKRNLEYSLTKEEFCDIITGKCLYCGNSLTNKKKGQGKLSGDFYYTGIDRIDNEKGYTSENCVPCCWKCNNMKGKYSKMEFIDHIMKIYNHLKETNNQ